MATVYKVSFLAYVHVAVVTITILRVVVCPPPPESVVLRNEFYPDDGSCDEAVTTAVDTGLYLSV